MNRPKVTRFGLKKARAGRTVRRTKVLQSKTNKRERSKRQERKMIPMKRAR